MIDRTIAGRRYDRQFSEDAVALVRSGKAGVDVARDLAVSVLSVRKWVEQAKGGKTLAEPQTLTQETPAERELRRLKQENDYHRRQRDILKKALAIVSDSNLSSDS